jgi:hypothetical protein
VAAETITIPSRFNGPPDSGNGGYTAGLVAGAVGSGPAEVTLRTPPPLDRPLSVERADGRVVVRDGDAVVADGQAVALEMHAPSPVDLTVAADAGSRGPFVDAARHPFPTCFVCGPERAERDGLRIFAGPVGADSAFAAAWTPPEALAGPDGRVEDELVWAALDCPSSAPVANDPDSTGYLPIVLARLAVRIDEPVMAGRPHVVMAWRLAVDGRKRHAGAALYTADGALCAVARALWIELRPPADAAAPR